jgi:hypothetical protein
MKRLIIPAALAVLASAFWPVTARAHDNGWAAVGSVLTGVAVAQVLFGTAAPVRCETVIIQQPVYTAAPCYPAPACYYRPVYYPAVVRYVQPAPAYCQVVRPGVNVYVYRREPARWACRQPPPPRYRAAHCESRDRRWR